MYPSRGRPSKVRSEDIVNTVLMYKNQIIRLDKVVSKHDVIWSEISSALSNRITPASLYTLVSCNRYGIRNQLTGHPKCANITNSLNLRDSININTSNSSNESNRFSKKSINPIAAESFNFTITISKHEFEELIVYKTYKQKLRNRIWKTLRPGIWEEYITDKIWNAVQLRCGFRFRNHYLAIASTSGYIQGTCKCGSDLWCNIEEDCNTEVVLLKCKILKGTGKCGKRYLRKPLRTIVGKELNTKPVEIYRAEKANEYMVFGDPEPPHLHKSSTLHVAKTEYKKSQFLDADPVRALCIMKYSTYVNCVHNISIDPFFIHYWTNHQLQVYRKYCLKNISTIYIDATGSIVKKLTRPDKTLSRHIFLYQAVIHYNNKQFSVTQMLSERHTTNNIHFWLLEWCRMGAPYPREVVVDSSKALLNAIVRCFTSFTTIKDYANACKSKAIPNCYIRIDVAHFIKTYSNFFKNLPRRIKVFYMAAIGQLIMCRNIDEAAVIIKAILTIARSETEGNLVSGEETRCEREKKKLKSLITDTSDYENNEDLEEKNLNEENDIENEDNEWSEWGAQIAKEVESNINEIGDRDNAHYFPSLAERLIKDINMFPLWSCVCRNDFGYGRVPASSAAVEGEFNILKNNILKNCNLPIRVDEFVKIHLDFLHGKLKIVDAENTSMDETCIDYKKEEVSNKQNIETVQASKCPACINNDRPSNAHICVICQIPVHALQECSVPCDEEGYGQKRICISCSKLKSSGEILATREVENWRGLNTEKRKRSAKYLGQNQHGIQDSIVWSKSTKLPIIKNGSTMELQLINLDGTNYSFRNTCAFDSLLQIVLVALSDYKYFPNKVHYLYLIVSS